MQKIATRRGGDHTTGCLFDYPYFKKYYNLINLIAIDLSKLKKLDADPKAIQKINFPGNLEDNAAMFFIIAKAKKKRSSFFKWNHKNMVVLFCFILFNIIRNLIS